MAHEDQQRFPYLINGREAFAHHPNPTANQLLSDAEFEPADDFVLLQRIERGTRVLDADDRVELRGERQEFFAFGGGELRELTVNEHTLWWGEPTIEIERLRAIARVPNEDDLIWIRGEGENERLPHTGKFSLTREGVEHLRSHRPGEHRYIYFVDGIEYHTDQPELTGAQIVAKIANWNPQNGLVLEADGDEPDEVVHPNTVVIFQGRKTPAHFTIVPPATFGSV